MKPRNLYATLWLDSWTFDDNIDCIKVRYNIPARIDLPSPVIYFADMASIALFNAIRDQVIKTAMYVSVAAIHLQIASKVVSLQVRFSNGELSDFFHISKLPKDSDLAVWILEHCNRKLSDFICPSQGGRCAVRLSLVISNDK